MGQGVRVALVGATGAAGETTLRILEERKFPVRELRCFASARSVGRTVRYQGEDVPIRPIEPGAFAGVELAFCSAGSGVSRELAPALVAAGAVVIDKSSAFRLDPVVPLVVPEINPEAARAHRGIVASPNCTTIVTVMGLAPLARSAGLRRVVATSFQAVSGAGVKGIAELREQTLAWARGERVAPKHFPRPIAFNVIPQIDAFDPAGYTGEEMKLVHETRKILALPGLALSPTTVRVPVFTCHSVAVHAELETPLEVAEARRLFARFPGVRLWDDPAAGRYPVPLDVEGQDECWVGRVRVDLAEPRAINFWVVGDQLRKGAATNAVQIAELLLAH